MLPGQQSHPLPSSLSVVINFRRAVGSPLAVLVLICAFLTLVSPWTIGIPQVGLDFTFGFQNPVCVLVVLLVLAGVVTTNLQLSLAVTLVGEALLLGWFGWAMWLTTTPPFGRVDFPFVGIDLIGPGWFEASVGLIATGAIIARQVHDRELPLGAEVWLLSLIAGMGLIRLGRIARGVVWAMLVSTAVFLASVASPIGPLFQPIVGQFDMPTAPPTRAPTWLLLGLAFGLVVASIIDTAWTRRKTRAS